MRGYDESKLIDTETVRDKRYFYNAEKPFLETKKNPKEGIKKFFPPKFKVYLLKDQRGVLLNAIQLYNYRNKIIGLFETEILALLCMHSMQNLS